MTSARDIPMSSRGQSKAVVLSSQRAFQAHFYQLALLAVVLIAALFCAKAGAATQADRYQIKHLKTPGTLDVDTATQRYNIFYNNSDRSLDLERFQQSSTVITTIASSDPHRPHTDNAQVHVRGKQPQRLVMPQYPSKAIKQGIEGYVVVHFDINADGTVATPRVLEAKPKRTFDKAALDAVKQFQYLPQAAVGNGVAVKGVINKFVFQLSDHEPTGYKPIKPFKGPTRLVGLQQQHISL